MKRLSISLAVLAVVFALSSAFTSNSLSGRWFLLDQQVTVGNFSSQYTDFSIYDETALPGAPSLTQCNEEQVYICAVVINDANDNGVLDEGEEDATQPTQIAYKD